MAQARLVMIWQKTWPARGDSWHVSPTMKQDTTLKSVGFVLIAAGLFAGLTLTSREARADDEGVWVDHKQTLPPLIIAVDGGLGFGHWGFSVDTPAGKQSTGGLGVGFDAEGAIGIIPHLTVGARVIGVNFGDDAKASGAAGYASTYDLQAGYAGFSGVDTFNNPELWGRYEFLDTENVEVGAEARIFVPFADQTRVGLMGGIPVNIHLPGKLRVDTGGYVAIGAYDPVLFYFRVPAQAWFNVTDKVFLGPLTGLQVVSFSNNTTTSINLGFGVGYSILPELDLKVLPIYWPGINNDDGISNFGFSVGAEYRIDKLANR